MSQIIRIRPKHIINGNHLPNSCPVALALKEQAGFITPVVTSGQIRDGKEQYHVPRSVQRFVIAFDTKGRHEVDPFNFKLEKKS